MEEKVRDIIAKVTGLPRNVAGDANLYLDLGVASVDGLNLLTALETQFGVSVPDDEFVTATSITALTSLMSELVEQASGAQNAG